MVTIQNSNTAIHGAKSFYMARFIFLLTHITQLTYYSIFIYTLSLRGSLFLCTISVIPSITTHFSCFPDNLFPTYTFTSMPNIFLVSSLQSITDYSLTNPYLLSITDYSLPHRTLIYCLTTPYLQSSQIIHCPTPSFLPAGAFFSI
jgi:hypothetical protein